MTAIPEKIGKYKIDSLLGRGGMGEVYKAHDPTLGRFVALKLMRGPTLDDTNAKERFIREAQAAGGLRHPNIVTVYDLGEVDGNLYIAMEFIHGDDVEQIIRKRLPLLIEDKLNIMIQVCEGMAYAHKHEIVHRDLKPSNIRIDEEGIAKIMDFGIAKLGASTMTASGMVMGTPYYMSPEQVRGTRVDSRSDIFSLGAILYELFTFHRAFSGEMTAVFYKIAHEQPAPVSQFMDVPCQTLQQIIDQCLEKDKTRRMQSALELAGLLRQAQTEYRQSNIATISGIKTESLGQTEEKRFQMTPPPAAISTRKPISGPRPVLTENPASAPTKLMGNSHAPSSAPVGSEPTDLLSHPPVSPKSSVANAATSATILEPVPRAGSTKAILKVIAWIAVAGMFAAGIYFYVSQNLKKATSVQTQEKIQKDTPVVSKQESKDEPKGKEDYIVELGRAKTLHQAGEYEQAVEAYNGILQEHPLNAELHFLLGASKLKMRKTQEALLAFQKAVELDNTMVQAWQQIGFLLMNRMDYQGAEDAFQRAVAIEPNSAPGWEGLAQTYLMTQRQQDAEHAYKKLLEIEPKNIAAIYNLGRLQAADKDSAGAKSSFEKVLELNPNHAEAHNNLGALYLAEGQLSQAIQENERAIQLKPELASAHYSLFLAYEQEKNYKMAGEHLRRYLEITEDDDPELKRKAAKYNR